MAMAPPTSSTLQQDSDPLQQHLRNLVAWTKCLFTNICDEASQGRPMLAAAHQQHLGSNCRSVGLPDVGKSLDDHSDMLVEGFVWTAHIAIRRSDQVCLKRFEWNDKSQGPVMANLADGWAPLGAQLHVKRGFGGGALCRPLPASAAPLPCLFRLGDRSLQVHARLQMETQVLCIISGSQEPPLRPPASRGSLAWDDEFQLDMLEKAACSVSALQIRGRLQICICCAGLISVRQNRQARSLLVQQWVI